MCAIFLYGIFELQQLCITMTFQNYSEAFCEILVKIKYKFMEIICIQYSYSKDKDRQCQ